jgi:predicted ester cyclase
MKAAYEMGVALMIAMGGATSGCAAEQRPEPVTAKCATASNRSEANKAIIKNLHAEIWDKRNPDAVTSGPVAADLVNHSAVPQAQGAAGLATIVRKVQAAFPDITMKPLDVVADGDTVVVRAVMEGTHTGTLEFQQPLPATGKHVRIEQVFGYRLREGKVVETWMTMDRLDFMRQLGLAPQSSK